MKASSTSGKSDIVKILVGMAAFIIAVASIRSIAPIIDQLPMAMIVALCLSTFLFIMLSFIFSGYILDALGFILAVPLTMTARILLFDEDVDVDVRLPGERKIN